MSCWEIKLYIGQEDLNLDVISKVSAAWADFADDSYEVAVDRGRRYGNPLDPSSSWRLQGSSWPHSREEKDEKKETNGSWPHAVFCRRPLPLADRAECAGGSSVGATFHRSYLRIR